MLKIFRKVQTFLTVCFFPYSYDDGVSDTEDGPCPPLPDSADIDELSETECDRHHNSWIVIRGELFDGKS